MTMLSGTKFTPSNEFQFVVATPTELHLCDIRHRKVPLLSWALNMRYVVCLFSCIFIITSGKARIIIGAYMLDRESSPA